MSLSIFVKKALESSSMAECYYFGDIFFKIGFGITMGKTHDEE
ncbi:hypothetical protein [Nostoc sp. DedQUE04]|nr:hypothetical protein [Nostoc sp. DedQUE04]